MAASEGVFFFGGSRGDNILHASGGAGGIGHVWGDSEGHSVYAEGDGCQISCGQQQPVHPVPLTSLPMIPRTTLLLFYTVDSCPLLSPCVFNC